MPIYEYACKSCDHRFELLVLRATSAVCPECRSEDLERLLSLPKVQSESTKSHAMRAAKERDKAQATDRMHDRMRYEKSEDRHG
jgi:putative FmdB family regulatory protein